MRLTPRETDKLLLHLAGNLAKERRARGVRLNYPEAVAYISSEIAEMARDGRTVAELMQAGRKLLSADNVMDGVAEMIELSGHPFCLGVQWHPEIDRTDPVSLRIARLFAESAYRCRKRSLGF